MNVSVLFMKAIRKIITPVVRWYRHTAFVSGLESCSGNVTLEGPAYLWNDHVSIGGGTHIYQGVTLWGPGKIQIGAHVEVGINTTIYASNHVSIGNNCLIAANCYIIDSNHGTSRNDMIQNQTFVCKGPVVLEEDVWLGAGAVVLSGVHIGRGAVIGAQALVNTDIPDYAIAVGVPAKVIGYRKE